MFSAPLNEQLTSDDGEKDLLMMTKAGFMKLRLKRREKTNIIGEAQRCAPDEHQEEKKA